VLGPSLRLCYFSIKINATLIGYWLAIGNSSIFFLFLHENNNVFIFEIWQMAFYYLEDTFCTI